METNSSLHHFGKSSGNPLRIAQERARRDREARVERQYTRARRARSNMYQYEGHLFTDGVASPKTAADQFEEDLCANRHSLLFGLADASWKGPSSAEGANYASSLSQLIGCFHAAQKRASFRCDAGAWSDDKALRKEHWVGLGVPIALIVPTLHTCSFVDDPMGGIDAGAEADFAVDDDGQYVPVLTTSRTLLAPSDPCCELRLEVCPPPDDL